MSCGALDVLNCGRGHLSLKFDRDDPIETERAKRIVQDMLRRGYTLFLEDNNKKLHKVTKFDANKGEYIIADGPLYAGEMSEPSSPKNVAEEEKGSQPKSPRRVPMQRARATGIAPTAGG